MYMATVVATQPATRLVLLSVLLLWSPPQATGCHRVGLACYVPGGSEGKNSSCCGEDPAKPEQCLGGCCLYCSGPVTDPKSVCLPKNSSRSKCPPGPGPGPAPAPGPPPPAPRPCSPEVLHNGITLPCPWPPRQPFQPSATKGLIKPPVPAYLLAPPAVRDVSTGRSLFVDNFLLDTAGSSQVHRTFFAAEYLDTINPIITFDKPWERVGSTYARPFSGGVFWHQPTRLYRMYYGCGDSVSDDSNLALCLATSTDGLTFQKPNQDVVPNTNVVINTPLRSNNVWDAGPNASDPARRFVLADTNGPENPGSSYWLWGSPDGVHFKPLRNTTGITSDRGTFYRDPFRNKWVFSIKGYTPAAGATYGRHRMYWETLGNDPFARDVHWDKADPVLWAAADSLDQFGVVVRHTHTHTHQVLMPGLVLIGLTGSSLFVPGKRCARRAVHTGPLSIRVLTCCLLYDPAG
jgi:hypothetical protein